MEPATLEKKPPGNDWLFLGQISLPANSASEGMLDDWMKETLGPFHLPAELFLKLKVSVRELLSRINENPEISSALSVYFYLSREVKTSRPNNRSWGFFQLEKGGAGLAASTPVEHVVEFYFYLDM